MEEWDAAVHHATQALAAEPAHPKALFRRASALHSRAKGAADATQARADLEQLIALQPDNAAAKKLLASLVIRNFGLMLSQLSYKNGRRQRVHDPTSSVASSASSRCCSA